MANRIFDRVIIVDSSMGNFSIVGGSSANFTDFEVNSIAFWSGSTLGDVIITGANTALDHVIHFSTIGAATNTGLISATQSIYFSRPQKFDSLKCPLLTAGTAWIYLA